MKPVVVAKILQGALCASWDFSSAHWLHHPINVKKKQILILKYMYIPYAFILKLDPLFLLSYFFKNVVVKL